MVYGLYCIKDTLTGFLSPLTSQNDADAVRGFNHACSRDDSLMFTHSKDYSLYKIGEFDTNTGVITPCDPSIIITGDAFNVQD